MDEKWLKYDEDCESESCCGWRLAILVSAGVLYIGSIAMWVVLYVQFGHKGCPVQQTLVSLTLILSIFLTVVSCTKFAPHGTLLTSAVVTAYATYLCYSGLASHPDTTCNPYANRSSASISDMLVGMLLTALAMAATAWSSTNNNNKDKLMGSNLAEPLESGTATEGLTAGASEEEEESWWYYHLMMVACSLYTAMLLTDWSVQPWQINGVPAIKEDDAHHYGTSLGSFWVKIASQWICLLMYAWTLLAPYCLREYRDFGVEFDF